MQYKLSQQEFQPIPNQSYYGNNNNNTGNNSYQSSSKNSPSKHTNNNIQSSFYQQQQVQQQYIQQQQQQLNNSTHLSTSLQSSSSNNNSDSINNLLNDANTPSMQNLLNPDIFSKDNSKALRLFYEELSLSQSPTDFFSNQLKESDIDKAIVQRSSQIPQKLTVAKQHLNDMLKQLEQTFLSNLEFDPQPKKHCFSLAKFKGEEFLIPQNLNSKNLLIRSIIQKSSSGNRGKASSNKANYTNNTNYNINSNKIKQRLKGHTGIINNIVQLSSTHIASASEDKSIRIWNIFRAGAPLVRTLHGHNGSVWVLAPVNQCYQNSSKNCNYSNNIKNNDAKASVSAGKNLLLSGSADRCIILWDWKRGVQLRAFQGHARVVRHICILTADTQHQLQKEHSSDHLQQQQQTNNANSQLMQQQKQTPSKQQINTKKSTVNKQIMEDPFQIFFSCSDDLSIIMWHARTGQILKCWDEAHQTSITSLLILNGGRELLSIGFDCHIRLWAVPQNLSPQVQPQILAYSQQQSTSSSTTILQTEKSLTKDSNFSSSSSLSKKNTVSSNVSHNNNNKNEQSNQQNTKKPVKQKQTQQNRVINYIKCNEFLNDCIALATNIVAVSTDQGKVLIFSLPEMQLLQTISQSYNGSVLGLVQLNQEVIAICTSDNKIGLWKWKCNQQCKVIQNVGSELSELALFGNSFLISALDDFTMKIWE